MARSRIVASGLVTRHRQIPVISAVAPARVSHRLGFSIVGVPMAPIWWQMVTRQVTSDDLDFTAGLTRRSTWPASVLREGRRSARAGAWAVMLRANKHRTEIRG
jgi:hypothetical protein